MHMWLLNQHFSVSD